MTKRVGVYPGTFDPVTLGHIDIISRAQHVVDKLVIGVAGNVVKGPLFSVEERVNMLENDIAHLRGNGRAEIEIVIFDKLLINFVQDMGASIIVRGLRAVSDFEYEFQMAAMNARMQPEIETVFLMASDRCQFISSRFVKEIARHGGNITHFATQQVSDHLNRKFGSD